jgi:hypothetical protein
MLARPRFLFDHGRTNEEILVVVLAVEKVVGPVDQHGTRRWDPAPVGAAIGERELRTARIDDRTREAPLVNVDPDIQGRGKINRHEARTWLHLEQVVSWGDTSRQTFAGPAAHGDSNRHIPTSARNGTLVET